MVTLFQAPSNRLCHSPSSARVKGDPTSRYDVGDAFIKGCAPQLSQLQKQKSLFSTGHTCHHLPTSFVPATRLCCGISKFRSASNYYCWDVICVWQSCQLVIGSSVSLLACPFLPPFVQSCETSKQEQSHIRRLTDFDDYNCQDCLPITPNPTPTKEKML